MEASLGYQLIQKIELVDKSDLELSHKLRSANMLLDHYFDEILKDEGIHFTTLFTKVAYLSLKLNLTRKLTFFLHRHRKNISSELEDLKAYTLSKYILLKLATLVDGYQESEAKPEVFPIPEEQAPGPTKSSSFRPFARVHVFSIKDDFLQAYDEEAPEDLVSIRMNVPGVNDNYNSVLRFLTRTARFPVTLHLENVEVHNDGSLTPTVVVFEPDYLVDITTVSECFKADESSPIFYFLKKFIPVFQNKYLIIGNTANFFLDELFYNPDVVFSDLIKQVFKLSPLGISMMDDGEVRNLVTTLKKHFFCIREVVKGRLEKHGINRDNSMLEPSFYSPKYGFQGRLDLFSVSEGSKEARIIELKSGKPYKANTYGLNINHYVQTLLYDLMVSAVTDGHLKISNFVLYSSQSEDPLRFAPPLKIQQREAIKLRNQLVEIDYLMANVDLDNDKLFSFIDPKAIKSDGFARRDIEKFQKKYQGASDLSRLYFNVFTAFVAREQILAKTGEFGLDKSSGLAACG